MVRHSQLPPLLCDNISYGDADNTLRNSPNLTHHQELELAFPTRLSFELLFRASLLSFCLSSMKTSLGGREGVISQPREQTGMLPFPAAFHVKLSIAGILCLRYLLASLIPYSHQPSCSNFPSLVTPSHVSRRNGCVCIPYDH